MLPGRDLDVVPIVAMAQGRVIGVRNGLPWRIPEDLRRFRRLTTGHPIVMGRKTFDSIGRPLPERTNIVVTRRADREAPEGVLLAGSLDEAFDVAARHGRTAYVIGGGEVYRAALPHARAIEATLVYHAFEGDAFFPALDAAWHLAAREDGLSQQTAIPGEPIHYSFTRLVRGVDCDDCALCRARGGRALSHAAAAKPPWDAGLERLLPTMLAPAPAKATG